METKQLRKLLNKARDAAHFRHFIMRFPLDAGEKSRRYRDVSKIIEEAEKEAKQ